jgi:hypothetical protein
MAVSLSPLRTSCALPQKHLMVHISVRILVNPRAVLRLEGLDKLRKFSDFIETQTHDLLACSIVHQPNYTTCDTSINFRMLQFEINSNYS